MAVRLCTNVYTSGSHKAATPAPSAGAKALTRKSNQQKQLKQLTLTHQQVLLQKKSMPLTLRLLFNTAIQHRNFSNSFGVV